MRGYVGLVAMVNLSSGGVEVCELDEEFAYRYLGGRGFCARILYDEIKQGVDPLSPENVLVFATGPLTGTSFPSSGRYHVGAKSPLTGGIGESNAGGFFGPYMKLAGFDATKIDEARAELERRRRRLIELEGRARDLKARKELIMERLARCEERLKSIEEKKQRAKKAAKLVELIKLLRNAYRGVQPHLRTEFVKLARFFVQNVLNEISGPEGTDLLVEIGQDYTPVVKVNGRERGIIHLSGGERTLLALAYRIGMGHLIMQARTGRGLEFLMLDEPTESLGREDGSVDRLADAISRLRAMEQVIAVSHSEAFAERANHVIRVEKSDNVSHIKIEGRP